MREKSLAARPGFFVSPANHPRPRYSAARSRQLSYVSAFAWGAAVSVPAGIRATLTAAGRLLSTCEIACPLSCVSCSSTVVFTSVSSHCCQTFRFSKSSSRLLHGVDLGQDLDHELLRQSGVALLNGNLLSLGVGPVEKPHHRHRSTRVTRRTHIHPREA